MPQGLRPCLEPRCPVLVRQGRCPAHTAPAWSSAQPVPRIRGRRLQAMRARLFERSPLCVLCLAMTPEIVSVATIRDHIIPLAEGGADDDTNISPFARRVRMRRPRASRHEDDDEHGEARGGPIDVWPVKERKSAQPRKTSLTGSQTDQLRSHQCQDHHQRAHGYASVGTGRLGPPR